MPPQPIAISLFKSLSHSPPHRRHTFFRRHVSTTPTFTIQHHYPIPVTKTITPFSITSLSFRRWCARREVTYGYVRQRQMLLRARASVAGGEDRKEVELGGDGVEKKDLGLSSRLMTIPTVLTLGRVAAVPLLVSFFYMENRWSATATTSIFLAAAVTDWLDGYIARKMHLRTTFGAFLDPVADKLMVAATLVLLCTKPLETSIFGHAPWILTVPSIAIIGREITMSAVREWAATQGTKVLEAVAVSNLGKWKTATQMTALTILLASRDTSLAGLALVVGSGVFLLYVSAWLAVWSLVVYMRKIWRILLK